MFLLLTLLCLQLGIAGALAASSYALGKCGYRPGEEEQPEAVRLMLRLLVGPVSSVVLLIALVMGMLYPITRERVRFLVSGRLLAAVIKLFVMASTDSHLFVCRERK
jgi:Na+/melibiose symporter-like transporter